ncbi:TPA: hypothetical protein DCX15_00360 [bacterium]|nr:hypothetical protein [bacterium]
MDRKIEWIMIVLLGVSLFAQKGWAEKKMDLSLAEAIEIALKNNLHLKKAQETINRWGAAIGEIRSNGIPVLP